MTAEADSFKGRGREVGEAWGQGRVARGAGMGI